MEYVIDCHQNSETNCMVQNIIFNAIVYSLFANIPHCDITRNYNTEQYASSYGQSQYELMNDYLEPHNMTYIYI